MGRFKNAKEALIEYCRVSTAHGVRRAGWAKHLLPKIMWVLIFAVMFAAFAYLVGALLVDYWGYPVKSSTTNENGLPLFPSVTICHLNGAKLIDAPSTVKIPQIQKCNATCLNRKIISSCYCGDTDRPCDDATELACKAGVELSVDQGNCSKECEPDINAGEAANMIIYCSFNGKLCSHLDFHKVSDASADGIGSCFTFNGGKLGEAELKRSADSGPSFGLTLIFNSERHQHQPNGDIREGFRAAIHPPQSKPQPELEGLLVPTGMETTLILQQEERKRLEAPYSDCNNAATDSDGYRLTSTSCVVSCAGKDSCTCLPACKEDEYPLEFSVTAWPSSNHEKSLKNMFRSVKGPDYEYNVNELSSLRVFYKEFTKTIVSQDPVYSVARLLTQIGGLSGLLVGISLISVLECVEMTVSVAGSGCGDDGDEERPLAEEGESMGTSSPAIQSRPSTAPTPNDPPPAPVQPAFPEAEDLY